MGKLIRWLHLSDFHVGKDDYAEQRIFIEICGHVAEVTRNGFKPDFIFITGDIADKGRKEQYETFNKEFLEPLYDVLGAELIDKTYVVPGNHDLARNILPGFDREYISSPTSHYFDNHLDGKSLRNHQLTPRFKSFTESISTKAPRDWLESQQGTFTDVIEIDEGTYIGIVGINSAWLSKDEHDRHKLTAGVYLLEDALKSLPKCNNYIVLGHHPIDWFLDEETDSIRRILGQFNAIYLHGHLHKARSAPEDGAGRGFLNVQCGAAFQVRDRVKEPWVNGLLWGELDVDNRQLMLQPRHWAPENGWPVTGGAFPEIRRPAGTDWWVFSLPTSSNEQIVSDAPASATEWTSPEGWQLVDQGFLDLRHREPDEDDVLRFFDGSTPDWRLALSSIIPKRLKVKELVTRLGSAKGKGKPQVTLLCGAGGEGKSTAFLQTIAELLGSGQPWTVIWRFDETKKFTIEKSMLLPVSERQWLIASDDADLIADDLFGIVQRLRVAERGDVHFLLTCRDTDWIAAKGHLKGWATVADYREVPLTGIEPEDATAIVRSWAQYGEKGLGRLAGKDEAEAIRLLIDAAGREGASGDGAFFGAMLGVRIGEELKDHLKALLVRLDERRLPAGGTLLQTFAYIAAMHAEGLTFLSRPVLAQVLGYQLGDIKPRVLAPLGKEAAATTSGEFVFTRHRTIAQVAVELFSSVFSYDIDQLFVDLAGAAITSPDFVPQLADWRYKLAEHFLKNGNTGLAVRIGQKICEKEPSNTYSLVHLAKLYREVGNPELAIREFRAFTGDVRNNRSFFFEWGTAEGNAGNQSVSALLDAFSLSNQCAGGIPNNDQAKMSLAGLGIALGEIYDQYHDAAQIEGKMAAAVLGLTLFLDDRTRQNIENGRDICKSVGVAEMDIPTAFEKLKIALESTWEHCDEKEDLTGKIIQASQMTFSGLKKLIENSTRKS